MTTKEFKVKGYYLLNGGRIMIKQDDTIAAISTALGEGGIGIVRLSGNTVFEVIGQVFRSARHIPVQNLKSHHVYYGTIVDPENEQVVDEVLLTVMRTPYSYTREDVVEINCHGGLIPLKKTLELVLKNGARLAEPGEFTKRAFLNGRIDLAQAEAVIDIIRAKTDAGLNVAVNQLSGSLSAIAKEIKASITQMLAHIEASIDFPEHDIEEVTEQFLLDNSQQVLAQLDNLIATAENGKVLREGLRTVIVGKPNVGKSSLLNALLKEKRAIVTEIPGTTRDIIEEIININGIPVKLIDTAGIRETNDLIEKIGIEKTKEFMDQADLILFILDASKELSAEDYAILELVKRQKVIFLLNKIDLEVKLQNGELENIVKDRPLIRMSVKNNKGITELEDLITELFLSGDVNIKNGTIVTNIRHKDALNRARANIQDAINAINNAVPVDLVAIDLKAAFAAIGEITGESITEDILDQIFAQFCIGK